MISDQRLSQLIFAADHNGLHDTHAVKYFRDGPSQVSITCGELKELLGVYIGRTTAGNNEKSVQDCASATNEVSK